ncbi:sigma-70 family RNA polymerase sigma factor [Verrucomicrobiaceae bacterium 227]
MPDLNDDLTRYARTGSEVAFRRLVERCGSLVLNSAQRRVGNPDLAKEVAQNVFAALAVKAEKVSQYQSVSAWLFESTRRESALVLRGQARHRRRVEALKVDNSSDMTTDDHSKELRELRPHLEAAVDSLKRSEREILIARFFDERSFREIAGEVGKSESACKMSLSRALEKLQRFLNGRGITFSVVTLGGLLQTEFAQAAPIATLQGISTESLLRSNGGFFAKGLSMMVHSKALIFAAVMVLLVAAYQIADRRGSGEEAPASTGHSRARLSSLEDRALIVQSRSRSRGGAHEVDLVETHQVKDLGEFYLPEMVVEEATLGEIMERVLRDYRDICAETMEVKLPLGWRLAGKAELIRNLKFQGNLLSFCRLLALKSMSIASLSLRFLMVR